MAVGQNQWYHFGVGAPPILVYFSVDWDVHWGYGLLTHGHISISCYRDVTLFVQYGRRERSVKFDQESWAAVSSKGEMKKRRCK